MLEAVTERRHVVTTRTYIARAIAAALAVIALALPATAAAGEPKNSVPFITATSTASASGEPKNLAPFVADSTERGRHPNPFVFGVPRNEPAPVQIVQRAGGFDWGDAGIGGAATLALVLLVAGGAAHRHDGRRQEAHG
jgi:hypothetical protein